MLVLSGKKNKSHRVPAISHFLPKGDGGWLVMITVFDPGIIYPDPPCGNITVFDPGITYPVPPDGLITVFDPGILYALMMYALCAMRI